MNGIKLGLFIVPLMGLGFCIFSPLSLQQPLVNELEMHATLESIGVVISSGDNDNQANNASIRYRQAGESVWLDGPEMIEDKSSDEWRVSLVHLTPNTQYEIQVVYSDQSGVPTRTVEGKISTRPNYPDIGPTRQVMHVPNDGDLQSVIAQAGPGDTIRIQPGIYYTNVLLTPNNSGELGRYLTIEAEPGSKVIIDGSDPGINDPNVDNWYSYTDNIYFTDLDWDEVGCSGSTLPGYVGEKRDGDGVRYLLYFGPDDWNKFLDSPPGSAYYDCAGRLFIKTYDEDDPDNHEIHVSRLRYGIELAGADYVRLRNLEIRYFGEYGIYLSDPGADNNVIEGNVVHGIGKYHMRIGDSVRLGSADNLIQDNQFYELGYRDSGWTWNQQYDNAHLVSIRLLDAGPGNVIRHNSFLNGTDAISIINHSHHTDIQENVISDCMDDGIEVDNEPGQNIRVWGNSINDCYSGISNQDWFSGTYDNSGPVYIFRNEIQGGNDPLDREDYNGDTYSTAYAFKVGSDFDLAHHIFYYHNTIIIPDSDQNGNGIQDAGGRFFSGSTTRNNLFITSRYVFNLRGLSSIQNHDFDCDSLYSDRNVENEPFIQWSRNGGPDGDGSYQRLLDFQNWTGQEQNGIAGNGIVHRYDYRFKVGSHEIDNGCVITGFNDRGPWKYLGPSPDIGSFEWKPYTHQFSFSQFLRPFQ
jgi:hypothetical protein